MGYQDLATPQPALSIGNSTVTDQWIQYPQGATNSNQYYMNGGGWVDVMYVFPDDPPSRTGYQVVFPNPPLVDGSQNFVVGWDGCTGNTYVAVPNGAPSQLVCQLELIYNSPYTGTGALPPDDTATLMVSASGDSGGTVWTSSGSPGGLVGRTEFLEVALPEAVGAPSVAAPQTTATVSWQRQQEDPENAPVTRYAMTATPLAPTSTPTPAPTGSPSVGTCGTTYDSDPDVQSILTECQLDGLVAGTPYSFTVTAANFVGAGPVSAAKVFVPGLPPQAAPTNVSGKYSHETVNGNDQFTAKMSFTPVPSSGQGSSGIDSYLVQGYLDGAPDSLTKATCDSGADPVTSCSVVIPTDELDRYLDGGTFSVSACNGADPACGPASQKVTATLPPGATTAASPSGSN